MDGIKKQVVEQNLEKLQKVLSDVMPELVGINDLCVTINWNDDASAELPLVFMVTNRGGGQHLIPQLREMVALLAASQDSMVDKLVNTLISYANNLEDKLDGLENPNAE